MMRTNKVGILFAVGLALTSILSAQEIAFVDGKVFDGDHLHEFWTVIVDGDSIKYAGPNESAPALEEKTRQIPLSGRTLLPGLIEGHSHLLLHPYDETSWTDQVLVESHSERTIRGVNHARATLMAGFTTVRDLGSEGAGYSDVGLKTAINKQVIVGPRMQVAGRAIVATGSYGPKGFAPHVPVPIGAQVADGGNLEAVVREQIGHGADVIKVYADYRWGPGGTAMPTFTLEELEKMVNTAALSGRRVVAHASTEIGMKLAAQAGVVSIEHGDGGTAEVFALMKEKGVALCPTLAAGDAIMQYRGWEKGVDPEPDRIGRKRKSFQAALESGVTICAGSDVGVFSHGDNLRELVMMEEYGMERMAVLQAATSTNARVFGLSRLGSIKQGYLADLLVVEGNPLADLNALASPIVVMQNGILVKE